jgi:hypothetical protein
MMRMVDNEQPCKPLFIVETAHPNKGPIVAFGRTMVQDYTIVFDKVMLRPGYCQVHSANIADTRILQQFVESGHMLRNYLTPI